MIPRLVFRRLSFLFCMARHVAVLVIGLLATGTESSHGQNSGLTAKLAWDPNPEPDVAGYCLYYGERSGDHPHRVDVGNVTTATLTQEAPVTLFVVAVAYNSDGMESLPSNEVEAVFGSDDQPPVFTSVPEELVARPDSATSGSAVVSWALPVATDNTGVTQLTASHPPGTRFPAGTTTVTYTAQDAAGNTATASFTVTVASFEIWKQRVYGSKSQELLTGAESANPDGDGWNNFGEYALGLDPALLDGNGILKQTVTEDTVRLEFLHNPWLPDAVLRVETSDNLLTGWRTMALRHASGQWQWDHAPLAYALVTERVGDQQKVTIQDNFGVRDSVFYRLVVDRIP